MTTRPLHILFVDDEQRILDGLRRSMRALASEWTLRFASSGQEALRAMEQQEADVIVSDMRMPGMSGPQLLQEVRTRHPQTIRLALSGQAGHDEVLGSVGPVQQFLMKPCSPDSLRSTIRRLLALRNALENPRLRAVAGRVETLPPARESLDQLIEAIDDPECSVDLVGAIVARDPAMTAKCLQLVNSAFFSVGAPARTATEAVSRLGLNTIRSLAVVARVFEYFQRASAPELSPDAVWRRSCNTAARARAAAKALQLAPDVEDTAYTAGMLAEIGRLALVSDDAGNMNTLLEQARSQQVSLGALEQDYLSASQGQVGGYLLGLWGFAEACVNAVAYHEHPSASDAQSPDAITALHLARALATKHRADEKTWSVDLDTQYLHRVGAARIAERFVDVHGAAA